MYWICITFKNILDEHCNPVQSRTGYPCNQSRIPSNENRILAMKRVEMRTQGNPVFITSNGFAVKGVFESKKSMPDNGTLFCRKRIAIGALWIF